MAKKLTYQEARKIADRVNRFDEIEENLISHGYIECLLEAKGPYVDFSSQKDFDQFIEDLEHSIEKQMVKKNVQLVMDTKREPEPKQMSTPEIEDIRDVNG